MITQYKYSLEELENMMPFERDIYTTLLEQYIKDKAEATKRMTQSGKVYYKDTGEN